MRVMVMFDLPVLTDKNRRTYRNFRKFLIKSGFIMMQESIYCKLTPNSQTADSLIDTIKKNKPEEGLVQVLKITEKQYSHMDFIVGERAIDVLDTDERLVFL